MKRATAFLNLALLAVLPSSGLCAEDAGWQFAGWYGGGMYPSITTDPSTEGRLYLTSDVAGMWRSDDRGENWFFINEGLGNLIVACSAVAPSDPNVVYAGTKKGLVRSSDAGKTWEERSHPDLKFKKPYAIKAIAVDYSDPDTVFAGGEGGKIFVSKNGGTKWKEIGSTGDVYKEKAVITYLFITPDGSHLLAGSKLGLAEYETERKRWKRLDPAGDGKGYSDGFFDLKDRAFFTVSGKRAYWTEDHGHSWKSSNEISKKEMTRIAAVKGEDDKWVLLAGWQDGWKGGVLLSRDSGRSWEDTERNLTHAVELNPTREWMKGFSRPNFVAIDPFDSNVFYFTDSWGVWRSDDGGGSWHEIIKGSPNLSGMDLIVTDDGTLLAAAMDDGLLKSVDGGASWQVVLHKNGFVSKAVPGHFWRVLDLGEGNYAASASPWHQQFNESFTGNYQNGEYRRSTKGLPDKYPTKDTFWGKGYPRSFAKDPKDPGLLYMGIDGDDGGGFFYSADAGQTWTRPEEQPPFLKTYNGLAVDPDTKRIFWAACGGRGGIYSTEAAGGKWREDYFGGTCFFDIAAAGNGVLYAGGSNKGPVIYVSRDHGASWEMLHKFEEGAAVEALTVDPADASRLIAGVVNWGGASGGRVYFSNNGGSHWNDISAGLPENSGPAAITLNPDDDSLYLLLYVGGIYKRSFSDLSKMGNSVS